MRYIDISETIYAGMNKYPSDPAVKIARFKSLKSGGSCNLLRLEFGSHTGTHIDAPRHVFDTAKTVDNIAIRDFMRNVVVTDIESIHGGGFFKNIRKRKTDGILFKCAHGRFGLSLEEARLVVSNKIKLVGVDRMSVEEGPDRRHPVHRLLLSSGVIIIECLNLKKVSHGFYRLICMPLKIKDGDGAPARAVLVHD